MIFAAFFQALRQTGGRGFQRVLILGVLLAPALLVAAYAAFLQFIWWLTPDSIAIPLVGPVTGVEALIGWASLVLMIGLSVFLMVPVASAFTGLFLEDVAKAVEARHYPHLPPAETPPWGDQLRQSVNFLGLVIGANVLALFLYPFVGPLASLVFWAMNGLLLGSEYFTLAALRRLSPVAARAMRRRNRGTIWLAGMLMAAPLSVPLVNLVIPVRGAAIFTHLFHRMWAGR